MGRGMILERLKEILNYPLSRIRVERVKRVGNRFGGVNPELPGARRAADQFSVADGKPLDRCVEDFRSPGVERRPLGAERVEDCGNGLFLRGVGQVFGNHLFCPERDLLFDDDIPAERFGIVVDNAREEVSGGLLPVDGVP